MKTVVMLIVGLVFGFGIGRSYERHEAFHISWTTNVRNVRGVVNCNDDGSIIIKNIDFSGNANMDHVCEARSLP
jgi:hypothetical protein